VCEQIVATIIGSDKTETLCIVKPFDCTGCHATISLLKKTGKTPAGSLQHRNFNYPEFDLSGLEQNDVEHAMNCINAPS